MALVTLTTIGAIIGIAGGALTLFNGIRQAVNKGTGSVSLAGIPEIKERWGKRSPEINTLANQFIKMRGQGLTDDEIYKTLKSKLDSLARVPIPEWGKKKRTSRKIADKGMGRSVIRSKNTSIQYGSGKKINV